MNKLEQLMEVDPEIKDLITKLVEDTGLTSVEDLASTVIQVLGKIYRQTNHTYSVVDFFAEDCHFEIRLAGGLSNDCLECIDEFENTSESYTYDSEQGEL